MISAVGYMNEVTRSQSSRASHYPSWEVPRDYRRHPFRREVRHGGVTVWRSYLHASKPCNRDVALDLLRFVYGQRHHQPHAVRDRPTSFWSYHRHRTLNLAASLFRRLTGAAAVLNVQDIVPDAPIAFGMMTNPLQIRLFRWLERYAYSSSDRIIVVADSFLANLNAMACRPRSSASSTTGLTPTKSARSTE